MPHGRGRTCPDRRYKADGRLRESRGPGMPGPYLHYDSRRSFIAYCKINPHPGAGLAGRTGVGVVGFRRL